MRSARVRRRTFAETADGQPGPDQRPPNQGALSQWAVTKGYTGTPRDALYDISDDAAVFDWEMGGKSHLIAPLTIDAEIHDAVMAPPVAPAGRTNGARPRQRFNEAVRRMVSGFGELRPAREVRNLYGVPKAME